MELKIIRDSTNEEGEGEEAQLKIPILASEDQGTTPTSSPNITSSTLSGDHTWNALERKSLTSILISKPWLIPLLLLFIFIYFGFINILLYYLFEPGDIRLSEVLISTIFGPISLIFSKAEFSFRKNLIKMKTFYQNRPSSISKNQLLISKEINTEMSFLTKVKICFVYLLFCYPLFPGLFRILFQNEPFFGLEWFGKFIFAFNLVFGFIYIYLIAYAMFSLKHLISVIVEMAKQSSQANITNLEDLDDWNDDFLNFQNSLDNISKEIQIPISSIAFTVVVFTISFILLTIRVDSILFPEWFELMIFTFYLLSFNLYVFYLISGASAKMEESIFILYSTQMFLARSSRKKKRKELSRSSKGEQSSPTLSESSFSQEEQTTIGQTPPVVDALDIIARYWNLRPKGLSLFGVKIDRKMLYSTMGLGVSLSVTILSKIFGHFAQTQ